MLETIGNLYAIAAVFIGLSICFSYYVAHARREYLLLAGFLLGDILSSYYWAAFVIVMGIDPNASALLAYFGWNLGYLLICILVRRMQTKEERRYFHPLMLVPIPINFAQFLLYIQYGAYFNNAWHGILCTLTMVMCLQSILYCLRHDARRDKRLPFFACTVLWIFFGYCSFTASCFERPEIGYDPYLLFSHLSYVMCMLLPIMLAKAFDDTIRLKEKETGFKHGIRVIFLAVVSVISMLGFVMAYRMKSLIDEDAGGISAEHTADLIMLMLFVVSVIIAVLIISVMLTISYEQKKREAEFLRLHEQQQAYEAEVLRLEKTAADAANRAKSSFLADMSHEIRTPINAVLGMNEMILRETTDDKIRSYAGNVESAGKSLLAIINDILDFSKIEAGKMEIVEAPYLLSSVLNDVSNMILFRARAKNLQFQVEVDSDIPDRLYGDEVRVRQIVTNLLTNAVKYTREGGVTLCVKAAERPDLQSSDGGAKEICGVTELIVSVRDTGIGIREEDIDSLFRKFSRVDLQKTNTIEGTGLGLAITENLLRLMNGSINIESTYGEGSAFTVRIPQGIVSRDAIGDFRQKFEQSIRDRKTYRESFRAPDAQLLVVDDTAMNLVVIKGLLKKTQVRLDTAESGMHALAMTCKTQYDLVLLDQRMPGMDGVETLKRIRTQEDGLNRETPVICLTADAVQGAREHYLQEGFTDYLSKPVEAAALESALIRYLPAEKVAVV